MTLTDTDRDAEMWAELVADLRQVSTRRRVPRRALAAAGVVAALGLAAFAGYVAAPDREPAPDPVVVVCQEQDAAACAEMPGVR